jgi:hypothetical protein
MISNISKCSNLEFLSADFDFLAVEFDNSPYIARKSVTNDEKQQAKEGQNILLGDLCKNVLFVVFEYLQSYEIFSVVKCNKKLHAKMTVDPYFQTITT